MNAKEAIMNDLTEVFRQVFENPDIILYPKTTANDVEGWDSLSHVNLIMAVEMKFNISFSRKEAISFKDIDALVDCILSKLNIHE
jgi:acyl carrier protein